jgi:AraC family transcriptional regulator
MLNIRVVPLTPIRTVMLKRLGPYEDISSTFDQLFQWVEANNVPVMRTIGVYWDNPEYTDAPSLRSAACVEVHPGFQITNNGGLHLQLEDIPGGQYSTARYQGPYEHLAAVWTTLTTYTENTLKRSIKENAGAFEVYVNDASETAPNDLITDLYMPLA